MTSERLVDEADVYRIYELLLGRTPERASILSANAGHPMGNVLASFLVSEEFLSRISVTDEKLVVRPEMLAAIGQDLQEWLVSIVEPDTQSRRKPIDRVTAIATLLADRRVQDAIAASREPSGARIDVLAAALTELGRSVEVVRASALFDPRHYRTQLKADEQTVADPATHYLLFGERLGLSPSASFSPVTYADLNPDVAASDYNRLWHYEVWGRQEHRIHRDWLGDHPFPPLPAASLRPSVFLLLHEATYTGAPILGWNLTRDFSEDYDVVVILRRGGALEGPLRHVAAAVVDPPPPGIIGVAAEMDRFAEKLIETYRPLYVIANSSESHPIALALSRHHAAIIALVHEFWPGAKPSMRLDFYAVCAALIFPSSLVEASSLEAFRETGLQNRFILPQGQCAIPPSDPDSRRHPLRASPIGEEDGTLSLDALLKIGSRDNGIFLVIGLGAVELRKGVDLFIAAATALHARYPALEIRFAWIGTWEHVIGTPYAALLDEQRKRSGLGDRLHFFDAVEDLEPVYARADFLFLSSRLDPLPNVAIDAACRGIPVVCFDLASGMAELFKVDPAITSLVVPHLDSGAAAERIVELAQNSDLYAERSEGVRQFAGRTFNFARYARVIDRIGRDAAERPKRREADRILIENADAFDPDLYFGPDAGGAQRDIPPVAEYLYRTRHINFSLPPVQGVILRRPRPGFHPFIYAAEAPGFPQDGSRDPLAHYVERGMPPGRWQHPVLILGNDGRPPMERLDNGAARYTDPGGRTTPIALHGHFHYPDNIVEFIAALSVNTLYADLFLTANSAQVAEVLRTAAGTYDRGKVVIEVHPNLGRDLLPFLRILRAHVLGRYEIVAHLHGKRSLHAAVIDPAYGDRWRRFLWEHLLGPSHRAADVIAAAFRDNPRLGLVFPESGTLVGWEKNIGIASPVARRLRLSTDLPASFDFPAGTMFWSRTVILENLNHADFLEDDIPPEPLPIDGTLLHCLERLLPALCEEAGFAYATSYIRNMGR